MNMDSEARKKALEKIKKCLALGKSSNEHEAAAALRQAQKMMALHGLSKDDLGEIEYLSVLVVCRDYDWARRKPLMLNSVVSLISSALGVEAVWEPYWLERGSRGGHGSIMRRRVHAVRYFGPRARVIIADHAHAVVYRAVGRAWEEFKEKNPGRFPTGARASFYAGWCLRVIEKVQSLVLTPQEAEGVRRARSREYGSDKLVTAKLGTRSTYGSMVDAGFREGASFDLNKPVGQDRLRIEKL